MTALRRPTLWRSVTAAFVAVVLAGCGTTARAHGGPDAVGARAQIPTPAPSVAPAVHPSGFRSVRELRAVPSPDRLRIPAIGVDSTLDRLGREADGSVEVPPRWLVAGWYQQGPAPGQPGPAAILGHVDSNTGPAVFARLDELRAGNEVLVDSGGQTLHFQVIGSEEVAKDRFPSEEVYLPTLDPVLRLITCGGVFDPVTGHYRDNVIVSAALVPPAGGLSRPAAAG
jgi:hypothetical protein